MRLSVACNFDDALIDGLKDYPVYELYGKVTADYVGGGRPSFYLPAVDRKKVQATVAQAHARGMQFNYLLNSSCMGNAEYTREGQRRSRATETCLKTCTKERSGGHQGRPTSSTSPG